MLKGHENALLNLFFISRDVRKYLLSFLLPFDERVIKGTRHTNNFVAFPFVTASFGYLRLLQFYYTCNPTCIDSNAFLYAASSGNLHVLDWLLLIGLRISSFFVNDMVKFGNLDGLKWYHGKVVNLQNDGYVCIQASIHGHLHILQWARDCNFKSPWNWMDIPVDADLLTWSRKWIITKGHVALLYA
jgi:hypothetical protein